MKNNEEIVKLPNILPKSQGQSQRFSEWQGSVLEVAVKYQNRMEAS